MPKTETIQAEDIEVLNTSSEPEPKITRVRVEEEDSSSSSNGIPSVEEFLKNMNGGNAAGGGSPFGDNPIMKILSDPEEQAKAKRGAVLILFSILFGIIGLFGFREYMATSSVILGILAYFFGADILKKGAMFGIFLGLLGVVLLVR